MKILSAAQIRQLDKVTIENERIASIELMERASMAFCAWFISKFNTSFEIIFFVGTGNNGGDGLAIARLLRKEGYNVAVHLIGDVNQGSEDFKLNLNKLPKEITLSNYKQGNNIEEVKEQKVLIDAIFGTGLNRPVGGIYKEAIDYINSFKAIRVAVDIPSGLFCDKLNSIDDPIVRADYTVTFELPKLCFLLPENEKFVGDWSVAEIGLDKPFIESAATPYKFSIDDVISKKIRKRPRFSHKGTFGHALILAGSYGKIGAAVLCAKACLKTGVGLLTVQIPKCGYEIMQISIPEAMCLPDDSERVLATLPSVAEYNAIGIGPGISKEQPTKVLLESLIKELKKPLVIDADALNLLSENKQLLDILPPDSILTPHPKEFERLAGPAENSLIRLNLLKEFCIKYKCITVLKGANTAICDFTGQIYFNSTGNPGMATGGSGDALTGIITSLIAQGYSSLDAAIVGVYLHGFAGDCAAKEKSFESLTATDIIDNIYCFFKKFSPFNS